MNGERRGLVAALALITLSLIWGYNFVVMKRVMAYAGAFDFTAMRTVLGALTLFVALAVLRRPLRPVALRRTFVLGLLQTAVFTLLMQFALASGAAGKTAVLVYTMPFWLMLLSAPLLGERVHGAQWGAVLLAAGGLLLILEPWNLAGSWRANLLAVAGGLVWAVSAIYAKRLRASVKLDLLSLTAWQMLLGSIVVAAIAPFVPASPVEPTAYFWGALAYASIAATGIAWLLWLYLLHNLPANIAGLASLCVPVVGVLSAWLDLGERPDAGELAGMLFIVAALVLLTAIAFARGRRAVRR